MRIVVTTSSTFKKATEVLRDQAGDALPVVDALLAQARTAARLMHRADKEHNELKRDRQFARSREHLGQRTAYYMMLTELVEAACDAADYPGHMRSNVKRQIDGEGYRAVYGEVTR